MSKNKTPKKPKKKSSKLVLVHSNAQRGKQPRVKPSLRIDASTDTQLKKWGSRACSKGVGDVVDKVVVFARKKNFSPCVDVTSI